MSNATFCPVALGDSIGSSDVHLQDAHRLDTYPDKLQWLIRALQQASTDLTPLHIKLLLQTIQISEQTLMPWADFSHPVTDSYGRKLVFDGGHFEIMVMSWRPGDVSAIHDHGSTQWGAVQSFGEADHYTYQFASGVLGEPIATPYRPGMVRAVDHSLIHQMGNTGAHPFLSLHVYGVPQSQSAVGPITGDARIFDLLEGCIQHTDGGVFFGLPEEQVNRRLCGLRGAHKAMRLHHCQMSDRFRRILSVQANPILQSKLEQLDRWLYVYG
ncbi:MAG: cysteine dioxygenase family protein [Cyanobacteria bacterium J06554_11]